MSLFGPTRPKGITQEELHFVRGELKGASIMRDAEDLNDRQLEEVMHRLELCLDADTRDEQRKHWNQVGQDEIETIEGQISHDNTLHLTPKQQEHVKQVLQKYIDINRHAGMFGV